MNLYLVIAIALGAITGVVEAPVMRPVQLVTASERRERRVIRQNLSAVPARLTGCSGALERADRRAEARRFTIAAPRAPAFA